MAEIFNNLQICGHILSSASYNFFALRCVECSATFGQWSSFLRHLDQFHEGFSTKQKSCVQNFEIDLDNTTTATATATDTTKIKDEFELQGIREEHSVFLEMNDEFDTNANETDEPLVEVMQVYEEKTQPGNESNTDNTENRLEQRVSSVEYLFEENKMDMSSPTSHAKESDGASGSEIKKVSFRFNLNNSDYLRMSLDFLKVFEVQRLLWDPKHEYFRNPRKRSQACNKIRLFFREKKIDISDKVLQTTINTLLRKYKLAQQGRHGKDEIDSETVQLLRKCSFLNGDVNNKDDDDDLENVASEAASEAADEKEELLDAAYPTTKNINYIPFLVSDPLFEDFIENYKSSPVLWDTSLYNYNHRLDRKEILDSWRDQFKSKYDLQITTEDLSFSILEFRRLYYKTVLRRDSNAELDDIAKFILEKGNFLPPKTTIQQVNCQHCSKIFRQEYTLKRHIYLDHGIGEKPFKCAFCEESFVDHLKYRRHEQRYHYKDYKYICKYCAKAFFTRDELDRHTMKHTGEKKFVCELCGRGFAKKTNLSLHNTRIHLRQRNFPCNMCPKAFYTKRLLQDHVNAHLNIRDKICPTCGKGFTSHHSLIRHKQIHSEIKKYACKLCDARFHQFVGLNSHMKNTHKYVRGKNETASDDDGRTNVDSNTSI